MSSQSHMSCLEAKPNLVLEEDFLELYRQKESYIVLVRNFQLQVEYIILSNDIASELPEELRTCANVYFKHHFFILVYFKTIIKKHVLVSGNLRLFYHLFDASLQEFFEQL